MIKKISLTNFRNFEKQEFEFNDGITIINASNAKGKTNILESIFMLSTGKSFKAKISDESINHNAEIAHIVADLENASHNSRIGITLTRGIINIGKATPEKIAKKKFLVNGISKRMIDFAGNLKTVLFLPEDLDLVTSTPTLRRKFLDNVLSQTDREYRRAIGSYEKGVRQRNKLLYRIREENLSRSHLLFWDQLLIKNGNYITSARQNLIDFINNTNNPINTNYKLEYDRSVISEGRLEQYKNEEVASATTLVGPHRDDFTFQILNSKFQILNLASFGSRGEQRMAVLWLKMAESKYIEEKTNELPTILLDDIFSELDHKNRKIVLDSLSNHQVIITSADPHNLQGLEDKKLKTIDL